MKRCALFKLSAIAILSLMFFVLAPSAHAYKDNLSFRSWKSLDISPTSATFGYAANFAVYKNQLWALVPTTWLDAIRSYDTQLWRSDDGIHWTHLPGSIILPAPNYFFDYNFIAFKDKLWILELGMYTTDGVTWTTIPNAHPPLSGYVSRVIPHDNKLWYYFYKPGTPIPTGGATGERVELWQTANGTSWTLGAATGFIPGRIHTTLASYNGRLWALGGDSDYWERLYPCYNDVWSFAGGSAPWIQVREFAPWESRQFQSVIGYSNRLWLFGGSHGSIATKENNVWSSTEGKYWDRGDNLPFLAANNNYFLSTFIFRNKVHVWINGHLWTTGLEPGRPALAAIPTQFVQEHTPWGFEPELRGGTLPIAFSLVQPPAGMAIDAVTGVVNWPDPQNKGYYNVTIRATNSAGSTTFSLPLNLIVQYPPAVSAPAWAKGSACTIKWAALPYITGYTAQVDDAPDFATPLSTKTLTSQTLQCTFSGLSEKKYYYRVRATKPGGLNGLWSAPVSCTQDATPPTGTVRINGGAAETNATIVQLSLTASDPGSNPSGVRQISLSGNGVAWSTAEPFTPTHSYRFRRSPGVKRVWVRFIDRAGNASLPAVATIRLTAPIYPSAFVDLANSSGPWTGDAAHPYKTIQSAIDAAQDDDEISVAPGTYKENIQFTGKNFILRSSNPQSLSVIRNTIIDGSPGTAPYFFWTAVTFFGNETSSCTLSGFTITNGRQYVGGGINGNLTNATIQNNYIINNVADVSGAGISYCNGLIQNNVIAFNTLAHPPSDDRYYYGGSAIFYCRGTIRNNTIYGNGPIDCGAVAASSGQFINNVFAENYYLRRYFSHLDTTPTYCCFQNETLNGKGNITADPQLANPLNMDFSLKASSPCIDAGGAVPGLATDILGIPRGLTGAAGNPGDGSRVDIGAFEFVPPLVSQLSRAGYITDSLQAGKKLYGDRGFIFTEPIPAAYQGQLYIRTLNADKSAASGFSFLASRAVKVIVAHSTAFGTARPAWLAGWTKLTDKLTTSDAVPQRTLYQKSFPAGTITLGPNREGTMPNGSSMYSVIVLPN